MTPASAARRANSVYSGVNSISGTESQRLCGQLTGSVVTTELKVSDA